MVSTDTNITCTVGRKIASSLGVYGEGLCVYNSARGTLCHESDEHRSCPKHGMGQEYAVRGRQVDS